MTAFLCVTCGAQCAPAATPPETCRICADERQYVGAGGQCWTTPDALRGSHFTTWREEEPGLVGLGAHPSFGIGQRALLLRTGAGNILWDCISLLDASTVVAIRAMGGLAAIAISHPHYYTAMADWAEAFGCPVHLHAADREWVTRDHPGLRFWTGETQALLPGLTLIRAGGHFPGGTALHWQDGAGGRGALLSGDIIQVLPDGSAGFMWSYPNLIPLPARTVLRVAGAVAPFRFDKVYGAFWNRVIHQDGNAAVARSAARYVAALTQGRA